MTGGTASDVRGSRTSPRGSASPPRRSPWCCAARPGPSAETRRRVLRGRRRAGLPADRTASLLARRRRHLLGVMLDVRSPFHAELVEEIQVEADGGGLRGRAVDASPAAATRRGRSRRCSTSAARRCCCSGRTCRRPRWRAGPSGPTVVVGRAGTARASTWSGPADDRGVGLAVDHLVALGHRRIAFVDGGAGLDRGRPARGLPRGDARARPRRPGRRHARRRTPRTAASARPGPAGRARRPADRGGRASTTAARSGCRTPSPAPAGRARGLLDRRLRRQPARPARHIDLTTVSQEPELLARATVERLAALIQGEAIDPGDVVVSPRLVVRSSSGPPAAAG